ncbi:MAG: HD domain-containing protein [Steroidobacterales bacterium]|jgi:phosphonate degradation associated HDIG domain protein
MNLTEDILAIYQARGAAAYFGERVTMTEHGLQAAYFAQLSGAPKALVVAALLHDIGHLIEPVPDALEDWTADAHHEAAGARWLAQHFPSGVSEPVRLHVAAKRYLCATDAQYVARLSPASVHTLKLQGGPMSAQAVAQFQTERHGADAVRLRHWDDQGKVAGLKTPTLREYLALIEELAAPQA